MNSHLNLRHTMNLHVLHGFVNQKNEVSGRLKRETNLVMIHSHTEQEKRNVTNLLLGRIQFWIHIWLISAFSSRSLIRFLLIHNLQSQLNLSLKPTYEVAPINQAFRNKFKIKWH